MIVWVDQWNEVINHRDTYSEIAGYLNQGHSVIVGWTDGRGAHHDVLFCKSPTKEGRLQGGLDGGHNLYVAVMRRGAFGFNIDDDKELHPDYVGEKLNVEGDTAIALARLISEVKALI